LEAHEDLAWAAFPVKGDIEEGTRDIEITHDHVLKVVVLEGISEKGRHDELVKGLIYSGGESINIRVRGLGVATSSKAGGCLVIGTVTEVLVLDEHAAVDENRIRVALGKVEFLNGIIGDKGLIEFFSDSRGRVGTVWTNKGFANVDFPCERSIGCGGGVISRVGVVEGGWSSIRSRAKFSKKVREG